MRTITLKQRIISLLTIFTIILVSIFITIQLNHEIENVSRYIRVNAIVYTNDIKENIEKILSFNVSLENKINFLNNLIESLKEKSIIKDLYIFDEKLNIITSLDMRPTYTDLRILEDVINRKEKKEIIDKKNKEFIVYIPLKENFYAKILFSLGDIWMVIGQVYKPAILLVFLFIIVNILLGIFFNRLIIGPIKTFNDAAKSIASGNLNLKVKISTGDELQELAQTFNYMTDELVKMKERAENANPLTKLPGNVVIREEVEKRIKLNKKFVVIYCDLDNFKAFNDKYGILKGDEAIKLTADIFKEAVVLKGNKDDFIGHEGGDDFILLTTPDKASNLTDYIISEFDKRIRLLYDKEDLERGFIVSTARDGSIKEFPIMTISLCGVSNENKELTSYAQITNIAAELKKKAKKELKSCFVLDRRRT